MKLINNMLLLVFTALFFASCERVIEVDLNTAAPRYVIEGILRNGDVPASVTITQTANFQNENFFPPITNAKVTLSDDLGNSVIMEPNMAGIFINGIIKGEPGRTYYLEVEIEGNTFTATSTMPEPVNIDSLYIDKFRSFGRTANIATVKYKDPADTENFYRFILSVNDKKASSIFVRNDKNNDGQEITRALPYFGEDNEPKEGDMVIVEMQSIDRYIHDYFSTLSQTIRQSAATPANPVSNISGGALGYFSAHTVQEKAVMVE
jgi:hypothetical protein